jgi:hypothetical protein
LNAIDGCFKQLVCEENMETLSEDCIRIQELNPIKSAFKKVFKSAIFI